jgi:sulfatase maturation enzyme AslB (radical SAM superfamily)
VIVNNGSLLHKHDFSLVDTSKITFYISYHGLQKEYNNITSSEDFHQVTENIRMISKTFPEVILRYVVNNKNINLFHEYSDFVLQEFPRVYLEYVLVEDLRYSHVQETFIPLPQFYQLTSNYISNDRVLLDGGAACFSSFLFKNAENKFDPLVNTMIGLVKKTKEGKIEYCIKQNSSSENIKSHWKKCRGCIKYNYCHGFDTSYLKVK